MTAALLQARHLLGAVSDLVGRMLPDILARRYDIVHKADGSPVTQADIAVEDAVSELLTRALPNVRIVGEESRTETGAGISSGWIAVLDPIDGTENFCSGLKEWGLSLSLWQDGAHAGSMLLMPELGERLISGDELKRVRSRITGLSSSYNPAIAEELAAAGEARITGCAVYNLYNVIRGAFARFVNPKGAEAWDLLAGLMLARDYGCDVQLEGQDYDGRFIPADRRYRIDIRHRYDLHPG